MVAAGFFFFLFEPIHSSGPVRQDCERQIGRRTHQMVGNGNVPCGKQGPPVLVVFVVVGVLEQAEVLPTAVLVLLLPKPRAVRCRMLFGARPPPRIDHPVPHHKQGRQEQGKQSSPYHESYIVSRVELSHQNDSTFVASLSFR